MSVSRKGNENFINYSVLEDCIKKELDITSNRSLAVIEPVLLNIVNMKSD